MNNTQKHYKFQGHLFGLASLAYTPTFILLHKLPLFGNTLSRRTCLQFSDRLLHHTH